MFDEGRLQQEREALYRNAVKGVIRVYPHTGRLVQCLSWLLQGEGRMGMQPTDFRETLEKLGLEHHRSRCPNSGMTIYTNPVSAFKGIRLLP